MTTTVVIAPLSNDPLRDWPIRQFREVAELCVAELDAVVEFVGAQSQRLIVSDAIRHLPLERYRNNCGRLQWEETISLVRRSACVLANNSGLAHLAAGLGVPAVSVFCGSHSPLEWMALGPTVTVLTKQTICAPCTIHRIEDCPFNRRCFTDIASRTVFEAVRSRCQKEAELSNEAKSAAGNPPRWFNRLPAWVRPAPPR